MKRLVSRGQATNDFLNCIQRCVSNDQGNWVGIIDPEASSRLQPELLAGETFLWTGKPNPRVVFHSDDWYLIPFSLLWGGFAIFWEAGVLGYWGSGAKNGTPSSFMALWGIPFIVIGQYVIWGRFLHDAWLKKRTYYAVTNRRVLVMQDGWKQKTIWTYISSIPTVEREGLATGTLWFGPKSPVWGGRGQQTRGMSRFSIGAVPVFADIDDLDSVYRMVLNLRESADQLASPGKKW
jgi:hypothetical protein